MTRTRWTILFAAGLFALVPAITTLAQNAEAGDRPGRQAREGRRGGPGAERRGRGDGPFADMNLTDEQKAAVREAMKAHREEVKKFYDANADAIKAAREKMQAARKSGDKEAAEAAMAEMKKLHESRPKPEAALSKLKGTLTDAQIAQAAKWFEEHKPPRRGEGPGEGRPGGPERLFKELNLTDEQIEKVKPIFKAHHESMSKFREANREKMQAAMKRMQEARKAGNKEEMKAAMQEMQKLREGAPSREDLASKLGGILTDQQMAKLKEMAGERREHRRDQRGERRSKRGGPDKD
jgi:Spy/CpxP family protein refolding chaperone